MEFAIKRQVKNSARIRFYMEQQRIALSIRGRYQEVPMPRSVLRYLRGLRVARLRAQERERIHVEGAPRTPFAFELALT